MVKLNTDEDSKNNNQAECGGIIRDVRGKWHGGFFKYPGQCSAFMVKLWGG